MHPTHQAPGRVGSVQVDDRAQIIIQGDVDEQTTSDTVLVRIVNNCQAKCLQSTGLEEVIVVFGPGLFGSILRKAVTGLSKAPILIDGGQLLNNMVVEPSLGLVSHYQ